MRPGVELSIWSTFAADLIEAQQMTIFQTQRGSGVLKAKVSQQVFSEYPRYKSKEPRIVSEHVVWPFRSSLRIQTSGPNAVVFQ
jgi:hypothetical protein